MFPLKKESRNSKRGRKQPKVFLTEERFFSYGRLNEHLQSQLTHFSQIWRLKERTKTVCGALTLCLNIGVDPPDVIRLPSSSRLECWIDPFATPPQKSLETISKTLQLQYESWNNKAKYKVLSDPTAEDVRKLCLSLRRVAKEERVLFHYNGHGVPKPTKNGEIWVFNKNFTQYIPMSLSELQNWLATPTIYVFDCAAAGIAVRYFLEFAQQKDREHHTDFTKESIILAACGPHEHLPTASEYPHDIFTCCLTTPIKIALQWFASRSLIPGITPEIVDKIPGKLNDRRTPLGELNWIFTAVTDTIAWNTLPTELFQKLFRQDVLIASLFRNYLLAERIMRSANCTPISFPKLPQTHQHALWDAWDFAVEMYFSQMASITENRPFEFKPSSFFQDQLTAFELWLQFNSKKSWEPPQQLPILLQVLLSQLPPHRIRALQLLARFMDLGPWAVGQSLTVGVFHYVLRLLEKPTQELRAILTFIWAKIIGTDRSCQNELLAQKAHLSFLEMMASSSTEVGLKILATFIISNIMVDSQPAKTACLNANLLQICVSNLSDPNPLLRRWSTLCIANAWRSNETGKQLAIQENVQEKLCGLLTDPSSEVRAAAVYGLGVFLGGSNETEQRMNIELTVGLRLPLVTTDVSSLVRKELAISLSKLVEIYAEPFYEVAKQILQEENLENQRKEDEKKRLRSSAKMRRPASEVMHSGSNIENSSIYKQQQSSVHAMLWKVLTSLTNDPFYEVAQVALNAVEAVKMQLFGMNQNSSSNLSSTSP
eukprot:TRINITY_DN1375_c0_g1_i1.p1 TRINITY_DN1375_c0_g1~~TRINITY_DN1375_c0_g1_i1.p1  ORF type:complete len:771 (-),score=346.02 TRINITY_DN1375_c0_g1_i1:17-2329(-)